MTDDKKNQQGEFIPDLFPAVEDSKPHEKEAAAEPSHQRKGNALDRLTQQNKNVNFSARLYQSHSPWNEEGKATKGKPLYTSFWGRAAIRVASRGLMGAAFMTIGKTMSRGYDFRQIELAKEAEREIEAGVKTLAEYEECSYFTPLNKIHPAHKVMYEIAEGINYVVGRPIKGAVKFFAGEQAAAESTIFRTKINFSPTQVREYALKYDAGDTNLPQMNIQGRTLGHEIVGVTSDFAMGSMGDAWGRNIAGVLDPNVHNDWDENGHFSVKKFAKSVGKATWDIISYRQAEDWAAALPYVYQMRIQRNIIDKHMYPGTKHALDSNEGSADLRVGTVTDRTKLTEPTKPGVLPVEVKGDFMLAGVIDSQLRFMGYNAYTLMFRDVYKDVAHKYNNWKNHNYAIDVHLPESPIKAVTHGLSETWKYVAKSVIKSSIYMAPAVPFYWMSRVPQNRFNAGMYGVDTGIPVTVGPRKAPEGGKFNLGVSTSREVKDIKGVNIKGVDRNIEMPYNLRANGLLNKENIYMGRQNISIENTDRLKDAYRDEFNTSRTARILSPIGNISQKAAKFMENHVFDKAIKNKTFMKAIEPLNGSRVLKPKQLSEYMANDFVKSSIAYTPYMIAKYETADKWDTPEMDASIYRMIDGIADGNFKEFNAGRKDIWRTMSIHPVSKITQQKVYEGRGLINSSQEVRDMFGKREGRIERGHADVIDSLRAEVREAKKIAKEALEANKKESSNKESPFAEHKDSELELAASSKWTALETSRKSQNSTQIPPDATIH